MNQDKKECLLLLQKEERKNNSSLYKMLPYTSITGCQDNPKNSKQLTYDFHCLIYHPLCRFSIHFTIHHPHNLTSPLLNNTVTVQCHYETHLKNKWFSCAIHPNSLTPVSYIPGRDERYFFHHPSSVFYI